LDIEGRAPAVNTGMPALLFSRTGIANPFAQGVPDDVVLYGEQEYIACTPAPKYGGVIQQQFLWTPSNNNTITSNDESSRNTVWATGTAGQLPQEETPR
jgi:hypothetical protein